MIPPLATELGLGAHPEGGWFRRTWTAPTRVTTPGGERPTATAIHYVLGAGEESAWHRVSSDELWLWHRGAALTLSLGGDGEAPGAATETVLGPTRVQALVPAGHWQSARPVPGTGTDDDGAVLVSCVVSPGFDFADLTLA